MESRTHPVTSKANGHGADQTEASNRRILCRTKPAHGMRLVAVFVVFLVTSASLAGCLDRSVVEENDVTDDMVDDDDNFKETDTNQTSENETEQEEEPPEEFPSPTVDWLSPNLDVRDFALTYWPDNYWKQWGTYATERHFLTGYYGAALDLTTGNLPHLGFTDMSVDQALVAGNEFIESMPSAGVEYTLQKNGTYHAANQFAFSEEELASGALDDNPSILHEMGRFLQYLEVPYIAYDQEPSARGALHVTSMPRHMVITQTLHEFDAGNGLKISLTGEAVTAYSTVLNSNQHGSLSVSNNAGEGWSFIPAAYDGVEVTLERNPEGHITAEAICAATANECSLSIVMVPLKAVNASNLDAWLPDTTPFEFNITQLHLNGSVASQAVASTYDPIRGTHRLDLSSLASAGGPAKANWSDLDTHNAYNRHRVSLNNTANHSLYVPVSFHALRQDALTITGGSPLLRSLDGEPLGHPLQVSKNWHDPPIHWFRLHTSFVLEPGEKAFEHTFAHAKWGETYAVQHAQLSLQGWGRNMQQWEQSSIGAWGESITYDPDLTLSRSFIDDVRPFLVNASKPWDWTGNVGGANFLVYDFEGRTSFPDHQLTRTRSFHAATGPCLTEATYASISADGKISMKASAQLGRTNDLVRAWYTLEYEFLDDVEYDRLALFQMAADRYGDNGFSKYAYGNERGTIFAGPISTGGNTGYADASLRGIPVEGEAWGMLYQNEWTDGNLPEHHANLVFVVRDYAYETPHSTITTPHLNIVQTNNRAEQVSIELGLPFDQANPVVAAGSKVRFVIEYIVLPSSQESYYGDARWVLSTDPSVFQSPDMAMLMVNQNRMSVTVQTGELLEATPIIIKMNQTNNLAEFNLTSGLSYAPVTLTGLPTSLGWVLQEEVNGQWVNVNQSVHGNDFWQAGYDETTQTWTLTFNLKNEAPTSYRLTHTTSTLHSM